MNKKFILFLFLLALPLNVVCANDGFVEKAKEKVKNFFTKTVFEDQNLKKFAEEHPELKLDDDFCKLSKTEQRVVYGKIAMCAVAAIVVPCAIVWVARKIYKKLTANEEDSEKEKDPSSPDTSEEEKESEK